jgi:hypothetical protein
MAALAYLPALYFGAEAASDSFSSSLGGGNAPGAHGEPSKDEPKLVTAKAVTMPFEDGVTPDGHRVDAALPPNMNEGYSSIGAPDDDDHFEDEDKDLSGSGAKNFPIIASLRGVHPLRCAGSSVAEQFVSAAEQEAKNDPVFTDRDVIEKTRQWERVYGVPTKVGQRDDQFGPPRL